MDYDRPVYSPLYPSHTYGGEYDGYGYGDDAPRRAPARPPVETLHTDYLPPYVMRHLVRLSSGPLTRAGQGHGRGGGDQRQSQGHNSDRQPFGGGAQHVVVVGHCIGCNADHTRAEVDDMPGMSRRVGRCTRTGATVRMFFTPKIVLRSNSGREGWPQ